MQHAYAEWGQSAQAGLGADLEQRTLREYAPLVKRVVRQLSAQASAVMDREDMEQIGLMGLLEALRRYGEPDEAFGAAPVEEWRQPVEGCPVGGGEGAGFGGGKEIGRIPEGAGKLGVEAAHDGAAGNVRGFRHSVGARRRFGQAARDVIAEPAAANHGREQQPIVEAVHDQNGLAFDLDHPVVDLRSEASVHFQLASEHGAAALEGGEIEIGKDDGLLHLEGPGGDKKDVGGVGFDVRDRLAGKAPGGAFEKARVHCP